MKITYNEKQACFHLQNDTISYIMQIVKDGYLCHMYWGKKIENYNGSNPLMFYDRAFSPNPYKNDRTFSLDTIPQEYPTYGRGDFRTPAYQVELENGTIVSDLRFSSYKIYDGKTQLTGLPCTYVEDINDAMTLEITMLDEIIHLKVVLSYTIFKNYDVIARNTKFVNMGIAPIKLLRAMSACIDFREANFDLMTLYGAHTNEKNINRRKLVHGKQIVDSTRGSSSIQQAPFMALLRSDTNEDHGEVYSFNLVYSGNFTAQTEVDQFNNTRVIMGINDFNFTWTLNNDETFQTPELVMIYSDKGLNGMSHNYHKLYTKQLCRGINRDKIRPILINNWEATYFNFNSDKIIELAKASKELGIELFVLDDGWFKNRNNDKTSLGDWVVDTNKLPNGLDHLANTINTIGLDFGLWFEPEMVSEESDLYKAHPDWCIQVPYYTKTTGRCQLILDLSRKEVCDYIIKSLSTVLKSANITYVKWDMNRNMTEPGSLALSAKDQKETSHRYILGLYYILEELTTAFDYILFESCSSGGGRFDAGMLYYMPQTWTSDNTDAIARLKIQYGTSLIYPPITMGAHVSDVPNHQMGRITSLQTRGYVAMSGNLGYELDACKLDENDREIVKDQINLYKQIRNTIQFGDFYRIISPFETNETAWNFIAEDKNEAIAMYFKILSQPAPYNTLLKLKGLNPSHRYKDVETNQIFGGDELMNIGIIIPIQGGDFTSKMWIFRKV